MSDLVLNRHANCQAAFQTPAAHGALHPGLFSPEKGEFGYASYINGGYLGIWGGGGKRGPEQRNHGKSGP